MELLHQFSSGEEILKVPGPGGAVLCAGPLKWPLCVYVYDGEALEATATSSEDPAACT